MILLERVTPKMHHRGLFSLGLAALLVLPGLSRGQAPATEVEASTPRAKPAAPGELPQPAEPVESAEPADVADPIEPPQPAQPPRPARPARRVRAVEPIEPPEVVPGEAAPEIAPPPVEISPAGGTRPTPTPQRARRALRVVESAPPPMAGGGVGGLGLDPRFQDAHANRLLDLERRLLELQAEIMKIRDEDNSPNRRSEPAALPGGGYGAAPAVRARKERAARIGLPPSTIAPPSGLGGAPGAPPVPQPPGTPDVPIAPAPGTPGIPGFPGAVGTPGNPGTAAIGLPGLPGAAPIAIAPAAPGPRGEVFRRKHRLTPAKANALAQFIEDNVDAGVRVEAKGEVITVTADAEAHAAIEGFISLLKKEKRENNPAARQ